MPRIVHLLRWAGFRLTLERSRAAELNAGFLVGDFRKADLCAASIPERRCRTRSFGGLFDSFERSMGAPFLSGFEDCSKFLVSHGLVDSIDSIRQTGNRPGGHQRRVGVGRLHIPPKRTPFFRSFDQSGTNCVSLDIPANSQEMSVILYREALESPLVNMSFAPCPSPDVW